MKKLVKEGMNEKERSWDQIFKKDLKMRNVLKSMNYYL